MGLLGRVREGWLRLSPLQLARGSRVGAAGQFVGSMLALGVMLWQGLWWWGVFLVFLCVSLWFVFVGEDRKVKRLEELYGGGGSE